MLKLAALLAMLSLATPAMADPGWNAAHPRRAEVNGRLANQNRRIDAGVRDGELSRGEARRLHGEDRSIRREERRMAWRDGGHITGRDQRIINRQENGVSRQIYGERRGY